MSHPRLHAALGAALVTLAAATARTGPAGVDAPGNVPAAADTPALGDDRPAPADLAALLALARERNREARAARARAEAASHRIRPAGALEDPTLGIGYREGMPADFPSIGREPMTMAELSIEQMLPGRGKRALRREVAGWTWREAEARARSVEIRVATEVRMRYWEIYRVDVERGILEQTRDSLRAIAAGAEARYAVGQGLQEDVLRAGLEISMATERIRMLERERRSEAAELNALLDRDPQEPIGRPVESPVYALPAMDTLATDVLELNPTVAGLGHAVRMSQAGERLAESERRPDLGVMAALMPRGALPAMFSVGLRFSLPVRQSARQDEWLREATALRVGAEEELAGELREVRARLADLHATAETARGLVELYDSSIVPQASLALRSSLAGYQSARVDFMTVVANVVALRQYEVERARRVSEFHRAVAGIEELIARPLGEVVNP